ncbi:MAG: tRNA epoxyqueuosine(34) reductase QueG [Candidatus Melainabacteria bacterium RIFCSPHIGHO2_02_FULL_34_12]|nr:MAG: tRNA epoxyqueuosine(34) reductase QueG [Candidatus Melainabacteria bacterium RIFCSPHIGHO2_02_FULL_34_12]
MSDIKRLITDIAFDLGFDAVGITLADDISSSNEHFLKWREKGFAADMSYLLREDPINAKPKQILSEAKSVISLLVNYYTEAPSDPGTNYGRIAAYAVGIDYHKVLRKKIKLFQEKIKEEVGDRFISKGFSDSVPLLEKSFARNSGLGFFGKNTLIINKPFGSYFFVCEIISNLEIEPDHDINGTCGKCTRCIDVCPTDALGVGALPATPLLDARLCISYQTIENRGNIPIDLRKKFGSWMFGCDLCQLVCPYNKKIKETSWQEFKPESGFGHWIKLADVLKIRTEDEFHARFCHTALTRPKRSGFLRNAAIVAGNRLSEEALPELIWLAENEADPVIREHVLWALSKYDDRKVKQCISNYLINK